MAFQPAPNIAQFAMRFLQAGQHVENVYHCYRSQGWDANSLNETAGTFKNWWDGDMQSLVAPNVQLLSIIGTDLTSETGVGVEYADGLPIAGTNPGQAPPNNVTIAVKWGTGLAGRSFRGRTYHIGLQANMIQADGSLFPGSLNDLRSAYDGLRVTLDNVVLALEFGVLSRVAAGAPRTTAILTPITGVSIEPFTDSQRRRLPGRGR